MCVQSIKINCQDLSIRHKNFQVISLSKIHHSERWFMSIENKQENCKPRKYKYKENRET